MLELLLAAEVDFVLVGGAAVVLHALPRFTNDVDIVYDPSEANIGRLANVLLSVNARLRGVPPDLPFRADERTLRQMQILALDSDAGAIDLLLAPDGAPPYAELRSRAVRFDIDGVTLHVASIDDLIAMKRAAGRAQDLMDIEALELVQRLERDR
jgi:hypothetical protein